MANSEDDVVTKIEKVNHFVWALCKAASEKTRWCGTNICGKKMYSLVYFEQPIDVNTFLSVVSETWPQVEVYAVQRTGTHQLKKEVIRLLVEIDFLHQRGEQSGILFIKHFPPYGEVPDDEVPDD